MKRIIHVHVCDHMKPLGVPGRRSVWRSWGVAYWILNCAFGEENFSGGRVMV